MNLSRRCRDCHKRPYPKPLWRKKSKILCYQCWGKRDTAEWHERQARKKAKMENPKVAHSNDLTETTKGQSSLEDDCRGQVLTFEEFYHSYYKGMILPHAGAFSSAVAGMSGIALQTAQKVHKQSLGEYAVHRQRARNEFDRLLSEGICREPTRWEKLQGQAASHPDHQATRAARRLLIKYRGLGVAELDGVTWEWEQDA